MSRAWPEAAPTQRCCASCRRREAPPVGARGERRSFVWPPHAPALWALSAGDEVWPPQVWGAICRVIVPDVLALTHVSTAHFAEPRRTFLHPACEASHPTLFFACACFPSRPGCRCPRRSREEAGQGLCAGLLVFPAAVAATDSGGVRHKGFSPVQDEVCWSCAADLSSMAALGAARPRAGS